MEMHSVDSTEPWGKTPVALFAGSLKPLDSYVVMLYWFLDLKNLLEWVILFRKDSNISGCIQEHLKWEAWWLYAELFLFLFCSLDVWMSFIIFINVQLLWLYIALAPGLNIV